MRVEPVQQAGADLLHPGQHRLERLVRRGRRRRRRRGPAPARLAAAAAAWARPSRPTRGRARVAASARVRRTASRPARSRRPGAARRARRGVMTPYSPSYPGTRRTCAAAQPRDGLGEQLAAGLADRPRPATAVRISSSGPSAATSALSWPSTVLLRGPTPLISPRISASGTRWVTCWACAGATPPAGRRGPRPGSARRRSAACRTPGSGRRPPGSARAAQLTPQARWPSAWYLPSSGKNSIVPCRPSPVRSASRIA